MRVEGLDQDPDLDVEIIRKSPKNEVIANLIQARVDLDHAEGNQEIDRLVTRHDPGRDQDQDQIDKQLVMVIYLDRQLRLI
jgi:hypothetical protein